MKWHLALWKRIESRNTCLQNGRLFGIDGLDSALEAVKSGEMQGTVYNDKEEQALEMARLSLEIFRGENVYRSQLKEGRYYVSQYQRVDSSNVDDFLKH